MRAMYSMDKTPSDITEPVGEASEPTVPTQALAAHTPADSETNSPDTAGPSSERLKNLLGCRPKLAALIGWYVGLLQEKSILHQRMGQNLMSLSVHPIAGTVADSVTPAALVKHAQIRHSAGILPSTISVDFSLIRIVLGAAKDAKLISLPPDVVDQARKQCKKDGLISSRNKVMNRPTERDLSDLHHYFADAHRRTELPMQDLIGYALYSTRRVSEICRLEWADIDSTERTGLVRDSLRPQDPDGQHRRFRMTEDAWAIAIRQPQSSQFIFPYKAKSVGVAFARACQALGITDLTFDSLRHEGIIRLFERGFALPEVRQYALCATLETLQRCQAEARPDLQFGRRQKHTSVVESGSSFPRFLGSNPAENGAVADQYFLDSSKPLCCPS